VLPIDVSLDLAMENAQRGRFRDAEVNLVQASRLARLIKHGELQWHAMRMRAWARIDRGGLAQGSAELTALHRRAARHEVVGVGLFCAFDRCMLLSDVSAAQFLDDDDLWALRHEPGDSLHIRAMKIRALTRAGCLQEARSALHEIPASRLASVAQDGQLVGSLAQLGRASIALEESEHAAAIAELLGEATMPYAINIAYRSEGSVAAALGELLVFLGQHEAARPHLERGIRLNETAGLRAYSESSRRELTHLRGTS